MHSLMDIEVGLPVEGFSAFCTFVGLLFRMSNLVDDQERILAESFPTF